MGVLRIFRALLVTGMIFLVAGAGVCAPVGATEPANEQDVKAVFLLNFVRFVEWPDSSDPNVPFVIGLIGDDAFRVTLQDLTARERVHGRAIVVRHLDSPDGLGLCQMVFVSGSDAKRLARAFEALRDRPILTVGESDDFLQLGGIINLAKHNHRVGIEVNRLAAERARLQISSKLLALAHIVDVTP